MALLEPVIPQWSLGERLAEARRDAGLDQENMAELLGVSRAAVSLWEQDRTQPRNYMRTMERWAEVTNVPVDWLLGLRSSSWNGRRPGQPDDQLRFDYVPDPPPPPYVDESSLYAAAVA